MIEHAPRETVSYAVPTASCVMGINAILRQQCGFSDIPIDLPSKMIQFRYRPDQVAITAALEQAQYLVLVPDKHEVA